MERKLSISAGLCFTLAFMILCLPMQWILDMIIAAGFHELCHFIAICLFQKKVGHLRLDADGARISLPEMGRGQELICAMAGPVGSFALVLFISKIPRIAICGGLQGIFNLLPIYPMDGGRVVRCLLSMFLPPPMAQKAAVYLEIMVCAAVFTAGCYCAFVLELGFLPIGIGVFLLFRCFSGKIPCKPPRLGVQ